MVVAREIIYHILILMARDISQLFDEFDGLEISTATEFCGSNRTSNQLV